MHNQSYIQLGTYWPNQNIENQSASSFGRPIDLIYLYTILIPRIFPASLSLTPVAIQIQGKNVAIYQEQQNCIVCIELQQFLLDPYPSSAVRPTE